MTLYEIDNSILECMKNVVMDEETGELLDVETGEILDTDKLDALYMERDKKIENIACWYKNLMSDATALKAEIESLEKRKKSAENKAEQLKNYLANCLHGEKFKTVKAVISFRSSQSVEVDTWKGLPKQYLRVKEPEVDKKLLKKALKEGEVLQGVRLVEKQNITIK